MAEGSEIGWIGGGGAPLPAAVYGEKAAWLSKAAALGLPVPPGFVLPAVMTGDLDAARRPLDAALAELETRAGARLGDPENPLLVSVRPSAPGGPGAAVHSILNIGVSETTLYGLTARYGGHVAQDLYRRLIQSYGAGALGIEGEEFEYALYDAMKYAGADTETELTTAQLEDLAKTCLRLIEDEGESFPQAPREQLDGALAALGRAWNSQRARLLRAAKGQDEDAGLPLIVQAMAMGLGAQPSGAGIAHCREETTGVPGLNGRFLAAAQGEEALMGMRTTADLTIAERDAEELTEPSLEENCPAAVKVHRDACMKV